MAQRDIRTVQALRAVACLLVVAYHATLGTWTNGAVGVDLFFVISGLVMGLSSASLQGRPHGWRVFAVRRLSRLAPLYWLLTTAKLLIGVVLPATLAHTRPGVWNIIASYAFFPSRDGAGIVRPVLGVGWTLQFEALFYALLALSLALHRPKLRVILPVLLPLALAGFFRRPDWPAPLALANGLVLEFCAGLALARAAPALARLAPAAAAGLLAVGLLLILTWPEPGPWRFLFWGGPATAILAAALALERVAGDHLPRALLLVGEASYAIYLLHPFLTPVLPPLLAVPACALAGIGLHLAVERPILKASRSYLDGRRRRGFAIALTRPV